MGSFMAMKLSTVQIGCIAQQNRDALRKMSSCNPKQRSNSPQELPKLHRVDSPSPSQDQRQLHLAAHAIPAAESLETSVVPEAPRRSGNYHPSIWSHKHITRSMGSAYLDERYSGRLEELKLEARLLMEAPDVEPLLQLRTIDSMQRLGVAYHFQKEIKGALDRYYRTRCCSRGTCEEIALGFLLLRQHGYTVSSESMLRSLEDLIRKSKDFSSQDIKSLLAVYEASHLAVPGEPDVEVAKEATAKLLKMSVGQMDGKLAKLVEHSLEMPLHWRMPRLEARDYINLYEMDEGRSNLLLELAKLDFNVVQSMHQRELRELSRWWEGLGLTDRVTFARDRIVENYMWAVGIAFEPHLSYCRLCLTKLVCILTVIDDIYDVHGSLEELELITAIVEGWNLEAIDKLPEYMKPCFFALYRFVEEVAMVASEIHGWDIKPIISKEWKRLCKAYLVEAKWFYNGHKPTLMEYLENAWITVGGPVAMVHAYLLQGCKIPNKVADCMHTDQGMKLIFISSLLTRLSDDLGTSKAEMERGDVLKSIECFMNDQGESEEKAKEYVKSITGDLWKELNEECRKTQFAESFVQMVTNMARAAQCIFQYGDGIGTSTGVTRERIISLFVENVK